MDKNNILIGVMLSAIFIVAALWHIRDNAKFEKLVKKKTDDETAQWLVRFAWSRTLQLLSALGATVVIFMSYDKQLTESRANLETLTAVVEKKGQLEKTRAAQQANLPQKPQQSAPVQPIVVQPTPVVVQPAPSAAVTRQSLHAAQDLLSNQIATQPTEATQSDEEILPDNNLQTADALEVSAPVDAPRRNTKNEAIDALYNPERSQNDQQSSMDDIKKRYEDILVIHLFLKKCNKIQPTDFATISYALSQEMLVITAPAKLRNDIINAAKGSYNEIYAKSPCTGSGIASLIDQYNNYVKVLASNYPQR